MQRVRYNVWVILRPGIDPYLKNDIMGSFQNNSDHKHILMDIDTPQAVKGFGIKPAAMIIINNLGQNDFKKRSTTQKNVII